MAFYETPRFPDSIAYGAQGGPSWQTVVIATQSGAEQRNQNWAAARHRWNVGYTARTQSERDDINAFFLAMAGRLHGFRFKDWGDFDATSSEGRLNTGAVGDGTPTYALYKRYTYGAVSRDRRIAKPVVGTVTVYRNAVAATAGAGAGQYALDTTAGTVTWVADDSEAITGHTVGASHQFTTAADITGLAIGKKVYITGATGTAATTLNSVAHTISNKSGAGPYTWTISTTTTGLTASGGTAYAYPQASDALTWAGQFDVPCRFDTDQIDWEIVNRSGGVLLFVAQTIPVVEIRV